jgi:hypothetical protein
MVSGLSRFLLPTFLCGMQRKVGAAPHRGNTNKPQTWQEKANPIKAQSETTEQEKKHLKTLKYNHEIANL